MEIRSSDGFFVFTSHALFGPEPSGPRPLASRDGTADGRAEPMDHSAVRAAAGRDCPTLKSAGGSDSGTAIQC